MTIIEDFMNAGLNAPTLGQISNRQWQDILEEQSPSRRFDAYACLTSELSGKEMADLFAFVWVHSEGCLSHEQINSLFDDFARRGITRDMIMSTSEQTEFELLSDPMTIFRGCQESTKHGRSWSTSAEVARGFAVRAIDENPDTHTGIVIQGICPKSAVLVYLNRDLAEQEILVTPGLVCIDPVPFEILTDEE